LLNILLLHGGVHILLDTRWSSLFKAQEQNKFQCNFWFRYLAFFWFD
jgi:hypothetical protein